MGTEALKAWEQGQLHEYTTYVVTQDLVFKRPVLGLMICSHCPEIPNNF